MSGSAVVFVGRVLVESGEEWGKKPARLLIEEALRNVPEGLREIEVNTSPGASCHYRLTQGERYVIFTGNGDQGRFSVDCCSPTFNVRGMEYVLDALRSQAQGKTSSLTGRVWSSPTHYGDEGVPGATVVAQSATIRHQVLADGFGVYDFRGLPPDRYRLDVFKDGFLPDLDFNHRWRGGWVLDQATNSLIPDESNPGTVLVNARSCEVWDLAIWPNGRISGTVQDRMGRRLDAVTVQAFPVDVKGSGFGYPLRTAVTDGQGRYTLDRLPGGQYVVGVNARKDRDENPYPPTVYTGSDKPGEARPIPVIAGEETIGVNLFLPPKRTPVKLRVTVTDVDFAAVPEVTIRLVDLSGAQRWSSTMSLRSEFEVPAYAGAEYIVEVFQYRSETPNQGGLSDLKGSAYIRVTAQHRGVTIVLTEFH
jgi:hypothetical protein